MYTYKGIILSILIIISANSLEAVLNFGDEDFHGIEADRYNWLEHPCRRSCIDGEKPKKCHYVLVIEMQTTMSKACYNCPSNITDCYRPHCIPTDGVQKTIYIANRQLPGPTIEVCQHDLIIVEVRNAMLSESTSIHWHGIPQRSTPYMDGVPYITQCPISPGNRFKYKFTAETSGTYFWHSHIGLQRDDGLSGPLIIHQSRANNPHADLYDHDDKIMFISDWSHVMGSIGYLKDYFFGSSMFPDTILINGFGKWNVPLESNQTSYDTPTAIFTVKKDQRYRFRVIHAGALDCPIEVYIDNHTMLVISTDANDIEPIEVSSFLIWNGERIDVVVKTDRENGSYWIRYRGYGMCTRNPVSKVYQVAILRYKSATSANPTAAIGYDIPRIQPNKAVYNKHNSGTEDSTSISVPSLNALAPDDESNTKAPDYQFHIYYDFYALDNYDIHRRHLYGYNEVIRKFARHSLQLNRITFKMQPFPLLSQSEMIKDDTFCNSTTLQDTNCTVGTNECSCTHVLQVKLNSVVELIIIDEGIALKSFGTFNHPLHLHGQSFRVVAMEALTEQISVKLIKQMDCEGKIERKMHQAPIKDSVKVPSNGYTIIRFYANNPGYWLYHCHIDQHMNLGMALVFKVGELEDLPQVPKHFPTCGDFLM